MSFINYLKIYETKKIDNVEFEPCSRCGGTETVGWGKYNNPICKQCLPAKNFMKRKGK